eukprot:8926605-Lingulodinium_polyedra.AAC.1
MDTVDSSPPAWMPRMGSCPGRPYGACPPPVTGTSPGGRSCPSFSSSSVSPRGCRSVHSRRPGTLP